MKVPKGSIQTYQRQVGMDAMPSARIDGPTGTAAYGANVGQAMAGMGDALTKAAAVQDKIQEDKIASDVISAQTEYRKRLSDALYAGDSALLNRKGENADGIDKEYNDTERKIRQEVMGKLPGFELAHKAFLRTADQESQSGLEVVNRYRQQEGQRTFKTNLGNALTINAETTARNYNNPVALQQGLATNENYYKTYEARFGKAEADALRREYDQALVTKAIESAWGKEDYTSMKTLLDTYGDKLGADGSSKWQHAITEKEKANDQAALLSSLKNDPAFKDANGFFDPQKAMEHVRGLKKKVTTPGSLPVDESKLIFSAGDSPDWGGATQKTKYGVAAIWNGLTQLGLSPEITSAKRNGGGKSWHDSGEATDIYLGDANGRLATNDPRVAQVMEQAKAAGFQEVLYHDAGNGLHLHVGNYQGAIEGGTPAKETEEPMYDDATLATFEKQFQAFHAQDIRKDIERQHFALQNVQDWLAVNKDLPLDQKVAFVNASGLRPSQADALTTGMIKEVKAEQKAQMEQTSEIASGVLDQLDARDALTTSSVDALAGQLTPKAYNKYMLRATNAQKTDAEKVKNAVDKDWHAIIKNDKTFGNDDQQNALIGSISEILDVEHTEGYDRRVKASKFIDVAREKGKRESIAGYSTRNNAAFLQMEEIFPGASTLVRKGDPNVDGYEWIEILKGMSAQTYDDPAAAKAWNAIFNNRLPLTENSFNELAEFYRQEGAQ